MKKIAVKFAYSIIFIGASVLGGWYLWQLPELMPCGSITDIWPCSDMPYPVDRFIRFCLTVTGYSELANPDDMEVLATLLYWAIATVLVGSIILFCRALASRHLSRKSGQ